MSTAHRLSLNIASVQDRLYSTPSRPQLRFKIVDTHSGSSHLYRHSQDPRRQEANVLHLVLKKVPASIQAD